MSVRSMGRKRYRAGFVVDLAVREKKGTVDGLFMGRRIVEEGEMVCLFCCRVRGKGRGNGRIATLQGNEAFAERLD